MKYQKKETLMNAHTTIPTIDDLKPQIYQLIEQLPPAQLPELKGFIETGFNNTYTGVGSDAAPSFPTPTQTEHPWLKFAGMFEDDPDWEEFQAAIAEYRREVDATEGVL
jgi:hypothetical protein